MTDKLQIGQTAVWGVFIGAAYGYYRSKGTPFEKSAVTKWALALGALGGATAFLHSHLGKDSLENLPFGAPPPPSPVVTRGTFAGYPRPLHHTQDADVHQHHEETRT